MNKEHIVKIVCALIASGKYIDLGELHEVHISDEQMEKWGTPATIQFRAVKDAYEIMRDIELWHDFECNRR